MLPYSDSGPFYRWHAEETKSDYLGLGPEDVERERAIVGDYLREVIFNGPSSGSFVGVMGFSNGAAVATSLILERHELALLWGEMPSFQFAWLFCGTYPPVTLLPPGMFHPHTSQGLRARHLNSPQGFILIFVGCTLTTL